MVKIREKIHVEFFDMYHGLGIAWELKDGSRHSYRFERIPDEIAEIISDVAHGRI